MKRQKKATEVLLSRREWLRDASLLLGGATLVGWGAPWSPAFGQAASPKRFLHVFLRGGWDSAPATDPVIGSKAVSPSYEAAYQGQATATIAGKPNLVVGAGLVPAAAAFAAVPTAFVNGIYVEVTAHNLASNYALSGKLSLSVSREYPTISALMGESAGGFPPHIVLGARVPLGDTAVGAPPLQAIGIDSLTQMLVGPGKSPAWQQSSIDVANGLVDQLDATMAGRETGTRATSLASWRAQQAKLPQIYAGNFGSTITLSSTIKTQYGASTDADNGALMAGAFLVLKSGLSQHVTATLEGFDTHSNQLTDHLTVMQGFATALNRLVIDLQATPDPSNGALTLAQTTTIMISSDFVRTPLFNADNGTDHWQSGSVILMGNGVKDNTIVGATDDAAMARGWAGGVPVAFSTATALTHEQVAVALLTKLGFTTAAGAFATGGISGLFT